MSRAAERLREMRFCCASDDDYALLRAVADVMEAVDAEAVEIMDWCNWVAEKGTKAEQIAAGGE